MERWRGMGVAAVVAAVGVAAGAAALLWRQNGSGGQGGHGAGSYDLRALQPAVHNWVRQSAQTGPDSGRLQWSTACHEERVANPSFSSPSLVVGRDGTVYAAMDGCDGGRLCALSPGGEILWTHVFPGRKGCFTDVGVGAPVLGGDGGIFVQSSLGLFALDPSGRLRWSLPVDQGIGAFHVSPALGADGTVFAAGRQGAPMAVDGRDGRVLWSLDGEAVHITTSPLLSADGTLLAMGRRDQPLRTCLFAMEAATGRRKWTVPLGAEWPYGTFVPALGRDGTVFAGRVRTGDRGEAATDFLAFAPDGAQVWSRTVDGGSRCGPVLGEDGTVLVCTDRRVQGLDPRSGEVLWDYGLPEGHGMLASTPIADARGTVYLATRLGRVLALDGQGRERWRAEGPPGMDPASPALGDGGRLYLGTRERLEGLDRFRVSLLGNP